jgi:hypothetical protein
MRRISPRIAPLLFFVVNSLLVLTPAAAQEVLRVDLDPLIEQAARHRDRFAVDVPHRFTTSTFGEWSFTGSTREWTYSVRIPSAVSMSFYAPLVQLPPSAELIVTGSSASATYRASDLSHASLWGRPLLGDTLTFRISVAAGDASNVQFEVVSLQAGYRGLSRDVPDHPTYRRLNAPVGEALSGCTQNYACYSSAGNQGPGKATVAVLIGNIGQCTGTLLNNTREDGRPYVLTARHCENGELGGGAPGAAASVTIYWDAVTPCGEALGAIYSGNGVRSQSGARTVVEQQDAWLIELNDVPRSDEPYYAGWDATGSVFVGGYSIHHAMTLKKQFVTWHGQSILQTIPAEVLDAPYNSDFWGVVNELGNVGAGASGGALFDPNNHVVGTATLAALVNGENSEGVCPAATPPAPSPSTITAQYTAFSAVWNSTEDPSSTTSDITLQSVLDPDDTGHLTLDGFGVKQMQLIADGYSETTERPVTLSWDVTWAQSCTASGGQPGDGWNGTKPPTGSAEVTELAGGDVEYTLSCTSGDLRGKASTEVNWVFIPPGISLHGPTRPIMLGSTFELRWDANVVPCTASDGLPGDGWAGPKPQPGDQILNATQLGTTTYSISCGSGVRVASTQVSVQVVPPAITLHADATRLRTGADFNLWWDSTADGVTSCSGSGGVPTWAPNTQDEHSFGSAISRSDVPGTFAYTMTCTGGGLSASSTVEVEFVNEAASSSLTAVAPQQEIFQQGHVPDSIAPNLLWTSNQGFCTLASIGPLTNASVELKGQYPSGTATALEFIAGDYDYELFCPGAPSARTSIRWITSNPHITIEEISQHTSTWVAGYTYQLAFTSNTVPCTASGGVAGDGWAGLKGNSVNKVQLINAPQTPGTYTYSLTCGTGVSVGNQSFTVTVPPAAVTLTASPANPSIQQLVTLNWSSTTSPCTANADGTGVNWGASNMIYAGTTINQQTTPGTYRYTITCGNGTQTVSGVTEVTFRASAPTVLSASATSVPVNTPVTLTWEAGSRTCSAEGGVDGDGWSGVKPPSGSATVTSSVPQTVGYALNCDVGGQSVLVTYTGSSGESPSVPRPSTTLSSNQGSQVAGQPITLTWSSENANACFAAGGANGDGWAGSLALTGTMSLTSASAGPTTYSVTCTGATPASTSQTTVTFTAAPGTGGGGNGGSNSGGGSGGGGALDRYYVLMLLLVVIARMRAVLSGPATDGRVRALRK